MDRVERQVEAQRKQLCQAEDELSTARSQIKVLTKKLEEVEKAKEEVDKAKEQAEQDGYDFLCGYNAKKYQVGSFVFMLIVTGLLNPLFTFFF